MQLTRAADYAVRVMIHLASQPEGTIVSKKLLAQAAEAPESFLSKILQALSRAGMIQTRRGVEGGFSLSATGAESSMLDVVECIDGPIALNVCLTSGISCRRQPHCAAHNVWVRAQEAMLAVLKAAKISEMSSARALCETQAKLSQDSNGFEPIATLQGDLSPKPRARVRRQSSSSAAAYASIQNQNSEI